MIRIQQKGDLTKTMKFLRKISEKKYLEVLQTYGQQGAIALMKATPVDTGLTSESWGYRIEHTKNKDSIVFTNSNFNNGVNIAIILQYGHATGTGGYVQGIDYINPALRPIFEAMADAVWKEVTT